MQILEDLYVGDVRPNERFFQKNSQYAEALDELVKVGDALTAKLNEEEFEVIKTHPVLGAKILGAIKEMPSLANGARWHHERYGGGGYPDNLSGEDIPIEARMIAVADSYDAMTSHRSYRAPLPQDVVRSEIENGKGTQFDPRFADIMIHMIDEDINYEMKEN